MRQKLIADYYNSPKYLQQLQARANYLAMLEKSPMNRARYIIEDFAVNPISFIETFGFIKIPEFQNKIAPFFQFDYQKEIILKLQTAETDQLEHEILVDKPRGMGVTWAIIWYCIWRWCFTPNWSGFILSRTETEVDDGTDNPDNSLFGKIRWGLKKLPPWIRPEGFKFKTTNRGTAHDRNLMMMNPIISSALVGSTTNANAGRSRRYSLVFVDECFAIDKFSAVWRALQSVAQVKLFVSTVKQGKVFRDFKDLAEKKGDYISLRWNQHPFKDQQWYEDQLAKAEVDPEVMKEVEVDYMVNIRSQYYPEIKESKLRPLMYNRNAALYVFLDFGSQDKTVIGWAQFDGRNLNIIEAFSNSRKPLEWYIPFLNPNISYNPERYLKGHEDILKKIQSWKKPVAYFGEAAHFQKAMPLNRSIADELVRYQIRLMCNNYAIKHLPRRNATTIMLPRTVFNEESDYVMELYDAIANSRYASAIRNVTTKEATLKPVHDPDIADYRAAFENLCVNIPRILRGSREDSARAGGVDRVVKALVQYLRV